MPKPFPPEFRRDVIAVARKGEAPLSQIAKDFGISESCLHRWLKIADTDDGVRPGVTTSESAELRELRRRNKTLEQENETSHAAWLSSCVADGGSEGGCLVVGRSGGQAVVQAAQEPVEQVALGGGVPVVVRAGSC